MVEKLEHMIDSLDERFEPPTDFVVPGQNRVSALLDVGRTVARRAERHSLGCSTATIAGLPIPQQAFRPVVDSCPLARWRVFVG